MQRDQKIFELIAQEKERQLEGIELIFTIKTDSTAHQATIAVVY